jgi:hypothetical protein
MPGVGAFQVDVRQLTRAASRLAEAVGTLAGPQADVISARLPDAT